MTTVGLRQGEYYQKREYMEGRPFMTTLPLVAPAAMVSHRVLYAKILGVVCSDKREELWMRQDLECAAMVARATFHVVLIVVTLISE